MEQNADALSYKSRSSCSSRSSECGSVGAEDHAKVALVLKDVRNAPIIDKKKYESASAYDDQQIAMKLSRPVKSKFFYMQPRDKEQGC